MSTGIGRTGRIDYLDGLRALAIGAVVIVHWVSSQFPAFYGGYIGVDIFFVLSGYIITRQLWRSEAGGQPAKHLYRKFLGKRVRRLYPALVGLVVGTIVVFAIFPGAPYSTGQLATVGVIALTQMYSFYAAAEIGAGGPFAVTWSLSIEWIFYLAWPLLVYRMKSRLVSSGSFAKWTLYAAAAIYLISLLQNEHWFYYGPVARIAEIMVGGGLALYMTRSRSRVNIGKFSYSAIAFVCLGFIVAYTLLGPVQWSPVFRFVGLPLTVLASCFLVWFGAHAPQASVTRLLSWSPMTLLGRTSYSFYLWHSVGIALFTRENTNLPLPIMAAVSIGLAVVLTALSYRYLEQGYFQRRRTILPTSMEEDHRRP